MKILLFIMAFLFISGCSISDAEILPINENVDVAVTDKEKIPSGFEKANTSARSHYSLVRAAKKAREERRFDQAIDILNEALPSAKFTFERGAIYMELAEIYALKNDLKNEMKYRLLLAENSGKEIQRHAFDRAEEIKGQLA